ncbi:MAG: helix-turn-helix domain-containing protein [Pseudonocardiaceae bacterium]
MDTGRIDSVSGGAWRAVLAKVSSLSSRELEVFCLLAEGRSNRAISTRLRVKERTAKAHVAQIMSKLDVESRLQAGLVAFAWAILAENRHGLALPTPPRAQSLDQIVIAVVRPQLSRDAEQAQHGRGAGGGEDDQQKRRLTPGEHATD